MAGARRIAASTLAIALATTLVVDCASAPDSAREEARSDLVSAATIVARAIDLRDRGAATSTYVRTVARQNAADGAAAAARLEELGAAELASRGHALVTKLAALAADDHAATAADLESLRAALAARGG